MAKIVSCKMGMPAIFTDEDLVELTPQQTGHQLHLQEVEVEISGRDRHAVLPDALRPLLHEGEKLVAVDAAVVVLVDFLERGLRLDIVDRQPGGEEQVLELLNIDRAVPIRVELGK